MSSEENYSDLMMDKEKRKALNLDSVVQQFQAAQQSLLGENTEPDFDNLFDDEN